MAGGIRRALRQSSAVEWALSRLPTGLRYTIASFSEKSAMQITIGTTDRELYAKQGRELAALLKTKMPANAVVLDFGCALGRPERPLSPDCKEIWGADVSGGMVRLARRRHKDLPNVRFAKVTKRGLQVFADETFDFVFSEAVLQHLEKEHVVSTLVEMHRVCKPGARVYLSFANLLCPYHVDLFIDAHSSYRLLQPYRMRYFVPDEVRVMIQAAGFRLTELEFTSDSRDSQREVRPDDYYRHSSMWAFATKEPCLPESSKPSQRVDSALYDGRHAPEEVSL